MTFLARGRRGLFMLRGGHHQMGSHDSGKPSPGGAGSRSRVTDDMRALQRDQDRFERENANSKTWNDPDAFVEAFSRRIAEDDLRKVLLHAYGPLPEARYTVVDRDRVFQVDDRTAGDLQADGQPRAYFCSLMVRVDSSETVDVRLSGNVPYSSDLFEVVSAANADYRFGDLCIPVDRPRIEMLKRIAREVRRAAPPKGSRMAARSKAMWARTGDSLDRLAGVLAEHWDARKPRRGKA